MVQGINAKTSTKTVEEKEARKARAAPQASADQRQPIVPSSVHLTGMVVVERGTLSKAATALG